MKIVEFGDPGLRQKARLLEPIEITSPKTKKLLIEMAELLKHKKVGVGLAAPQIGENLSLAVVILQPTKYRPDTKEFELIIINPIISKTYGNHKQMWEGCISGGSGKSSLLAKVPRYKKIELKYIDEKGRQQTKVFQNLPAQVIQHEVDHLNGVLFVDRVKDTKSYVTNRQYMKLVKVKAN